MDKVTIREFLGNNLSLIPYPVKIKSVIYA
jgi:hypothetical protein